MAALRWVNLIFAIVELLPPAARVLELPNKLALRARIQQHLYRGWDPFLGGPAEIGALLTTFLLLIFRCHDRGTRTATLIAAVAFAGMLAAFFIFNLPVNDALNRWTPATLPPDWTDYRRQWEIRHALAATLAAIGLVAVARRWLIEGDQGAATPRR